jgi:hypothetical protein
VCFACGEDGPEDLKILTVYVENEKNESVTVCFAIVRGVLVQHYHLNDVLPEMRQEKYDTKCKLAAEWLATLYEKLQTAPPKVLDNCSSTSTTSTQAKKLIDILESNGIKRWIEPFLNGSSRGSSMGMVNVWWSNFQKVFEYDTETGTVHKPNTDKRTLLSLSHEHASLNVFLRVMFQKRPPLRLKVSGELTSVSGELTSVSGELTAVSGETT